MRNSRINLILSIKNDEKKYSSIFNNFYFGLTAHADLSANKFNLSENDVQQQFEEFRKLFLPSSSMTWKRWARSRGLKITIPSRRLMNSGLKAFFTELSIFSCIS